MLLGSPLPSWKQLFTIRNKGERESFYEEIFPETVVLSESCMSIHLVLDAIRTVAKKMTVKVLLPDFFCNQTIYSFKDDDVELFFYPIKQDMNPDWDYLKTWIKENEFDAFLFTHYFGRFYDSISRAKEICINHNAVLIEDCAHVLYPTGKMGTIGDFSIFSPHKQLPIMDGGVLVFNRGYQNPVAEKAFEYIKDKYNCLSPKQGFRKWCIKKSLQKIIPIHRKSTYYHGVHNSVDVGSIHEPEKVSDGSYRILCDYNYVDLKRAAFIRKDNLEMMNYIFSIKYPEVIPLMDSEVDVPYFAVYSLEKVENKEAIVNAMIKEGFTVLYWPDLPHQLNGVDGHKEMAFLSENIIVIPIHQNLGSQKLVKKFLRKINYDNLPIVLEKSLEEEYDRIYTSCQINNIPQEWVYGNAKSSTEGWKAVRYKILIKGDTIGVIQVLEKRILGLTCAVRVNRGPVVKVEYDSDTLKFLIMKEIRKRYLHPIPIIYAPYVKKSPQAMHIATSFKWKCIDRFGFPSAIVDLSLSENELHSRLKAFWRKNLNHAKKDLYIRYNEYDSKKIIELYKEFLRVKDIPGIPEHILKYLFELNNPPLEVLTAHLQDGKMIAYKVLYKHGNCGTSFIAWNTDEGRKKQARTLLIWTSMLRLKDLGFTYFDLGGVDEILTEDVAKYKRGASGDEYILLGEFFSI